MSDNLGLYGETLQKAVEALERIEGRLPAPPPPTTMTRSELAALTPQARMAFVTGGGTVVADAPAPRRPVEGGITRADFDRMGPDQRMKFALGGGVIG